jgi:glutathione peroxidase
MTDTHRVASRTRSATLGAIAIAGALIGAVNWSGASAAECPEFLDQDFRKLHSSDTVNLCEAFSGKPLLIVNTASHCGFTYQFEGLERLHKTFADRGLVVLGFPSDDFRQEADDEETTAKICYVNYGVTFTMMAPIKVTGTEAHPLFQELATRSAAPNWNFNKYLVDSSGKVVRHFRSSTEPGSDDMLRSIEGLL